MTACTKLPVPREPCTVRFPGGLLIQGMQSVGDGDFERGLALMRAMAPALAALAPVFTLIQAILALKKFIDAFTSFPPDLGKLAEGVSEFSDAIGKLVNIAPPVSVPLLVKDLLTCMVTFLAGIITTLRSLQDQQGRIDEAKAKALSLNLPELDQLADCAQDNVTLYLQHLAYSMSSVEALFGILQELGDLAGLGIPGVDFDVEGDLDTVIEKLNNIVRVLADVLEAIP